MLFEEEQDKAVTVNNNAITLFKEINLLIINNIGIGFMSAKLAMTRLCKV